MLMWTIPWGLRITVVNTLEIGGPRERNKMGGDRSKWLDKWGGGVKLT